MKKVLLLLILVGPSLWAGDFLNFEEIDRPKQFLSLEHYVPERFEELPRGAKFGGLTAANYKKCIDALPNSNRSYFKVRYLSGNLKVEGFLALPKSFSKNKKYPFVIYNRGGNRDFGKLQACGLLTMNSLFEGDDRYILFAPQLRGTSGSEGRDEYGGAEIEDVVSAYNILTKYPFIDVKNKYLVGWSRGGMTAYLSLKNGLAFNATAVLAGVTDLIDLDKRRPDMRKVFNELIPNIERNRRRELRKRSALFWPDRLSSPLLLLHGEGDLKAPLDPVIKLDRLLSKQQVPHKLIIYPHSGHFFEGVRDNLGSEVLGWFKKYSVEAAN